MRKVGPALALLGLLVLFFLLGATLYPHSARLPSGGSLEPPTQGHILGTDSLGVDVYAQVSAGFFHSMGIGLLSAGLTFLLGGFLGVAAGYRGGVTDRAVGAFIHVALSVPQLPAMIVLGAFLGQSTWNTVWIITAFSWAPVARQVRAKTISARGAPYVVLARSYGGGGWYIFTRHMLREVLPLLAVNGIGTVGRAITQESALAYLGLSDPLARSWGLMISRAAQFPGIFFTEYWTWWLLPPALALIGSVVCLRLLVRGLENLWLSAA